MFVTMIVAIERYIGVYEGEQYTMRLIKNLETPRLTIRSWNKSDKDFTLSLWGDKENGKYMSDPVRENMDEEYLKCVDEMEDSSEGYYLIAELKENGSPVGTCCIFRRKDNMRRICSEFVDFA